MFLFSVKSIFNFFVNSIVLTQLQFKFTIIPNLLQLSKSIMIYPQFILDCHEVHPI